MVGAVLTRDGEVVGSGWHRQVGGPHAEVEALREAGERARGATLYVTLEPCSHFGRTPPCADAVLAAGISRVVACHGDPDPRVSGRGFQKLREAGVEVEVVKEVPVHVTYFEGRKSRVASVSKCTTCIKACTPASVLPAALTRKGWPDMTCSALSR